MTVRKGCNNSWIIELRSSWYVRFQQFLFLCYYFFELADFFFFQETYNTWLQERYKGNHSTHPELDLDLWLEVGLSGEPNKNKVYGISNTTVEELQTTQSVSAVGCSQSTPSTQSPEFHVILNNKLYLRDLSCCSDRTT
jgi:hypothetical protein